MNLETRNSDRMKSLSVFSVPRPVPNAFDVTSSLAQLRCTARYYRTRSCTTSSYILKLQKRSCDIEPKMNGEESACKVVIR